MFIKMGEIRPQFQRWRNISRPIRPLEFDHANAQMGKKFKMRQTEGGGYGIKKLKSLRTKVIRGSSRGRERSNSRNTSVSAASRFKKQNSTLN
jgi:hypothetical protein